MLVIEIKTMSGESLGEMDSPYKIDNPLHMKALALEFRELYEHAWMLAHPEEARTLKAPRKRYPTERTL